MSADVQKRQIATSSVIGLGDVMFIAVSMALHLSYGPIGLIVLGVAGLLVPLLGTLLAVFDIAARKRFGILGLLLCISGFPLVMCWISYSDWRIPVG